jgi:hypothetical protein
LAAIAERGGVYIFGLSTTMQLASGLPQDAIQISAGDSHGVMLRSGGRALAFGDNSMGQLQSPGGFLYRSVVAFGYNTAYLATSDIVYVKGAGDSGLTSLNPFHSNFVQIAGGVGPTRGTGFLLTLDSAGNIQAYGDNTYGQRSVPVHNSIVKVAAKGKHALALSSNGTVIAWGDNSSGEATVPVGLTNVVDIAAGQGWSAALKSDGTLVTWGSDPFGVRSAAVSGQRFGSISAGFDHVIGLNRGVVLPKVPDVENNRGTLVDLCLPVVPKVDTVVALSASPSLVSVPSTVLVKAGMRTVQFTATSTSGFDGTAFLTANIGGLSFTGALAVKPAVPTAMISLGSTSVPGGTSFQMTVTLSQPAHPGGTVVNLWTNLPGLLSLPASVTVPQGELTHSLSVPTSPVAAITSPTIYAGTSAGTRTAVITLDPPRPVSLVPAAGTLAGGLSSTFTVTLDAPAPPGGLILDIWSNRPEILLPGTTLSFDSGEVSKTVSFSTTTVSASVPSTLYARGNGRTRYGVVTITP